MGYTDKPPTYKVPLTSQYRASHHGKGCWNTFNCTYLSSVYTDYEGIMLVMSPASTFSTIYGLLDSEAQGLRPRT